MTVRALDKNGDWQYGHNQNDLKTQLSEVEQCIITRLQSWKNDCFFAPDDFVDWDNILNHFNVGKTFVKSQIYNCVVNTQGVKNISNIEYELDGAARTFYISMKVITVYGEIYIHNLSI